MCWCDECFNTVGVVFAWDDRFNLFEQCLVIGSLFEIIIKCKFASRFVCISPTFFVPIWEPEILGSIPDETLW